MVEKEESLKTIINKDKNLVIKHLGLLLIYLKMNKHLYFHVKIWFGHQENHIYGQKLPDNKTAIINKFKEGIINKHKEMGIFDDEDYRVINLNETAIFLEMSFNTWRWNQISSCYYP